MGEEPVDGTGVQHVVPCQPPLAGDAHAEFHIAHPRKVDAKNPAPFVLLDVVHERNVYPHVERVPVRTAFVEGDG